MTVKKKSKTAGTVLSVVVDYPVFIVETQGGKEIGRSEIPTETVALVLRDYIESAIHSWFEREFETTAAVTKPVVKKKKKV